MNYLHEHKPLPIVHNHLDPRLASLLLLIIDLINKLWWQDVLIGCAGDLIAALVERIKKNGSWNL